MSTNDIILTISIISFLIYLFYIYIFKNGLKQSKIENINNEKPFVSVVVAARNEEKNLPFLLTVLANQSYPVSRYEVIIADDQSIDTTANIVRRFSEKWSNFKLVQVQNRESVKSPKKNALTQAIAISKGEIILSTDADCIVGQHWISATVAAYSEETSMVCGFSRTKILKWIKAPLFQKFEHFDFLVMFFAASGAIVKNKYFSCSGQNISYRKKAFYEVGGFKYIEHLLSGDDVNLMQLMRKKKMKIKFSFSPHTFAYTKPIESIKQFLNQRSRWASNFKWQFVLNPEFFFYLVDVLVLNISLLILLFYNWKFAILLIITKIIFEYRFFIEGTKIFPVNKEVKKFYLVWYLLQPFYLMLVTIQGQLSLFKWQGRK